MMKIMIDKCKRECMNINSKLTLFYIVGIYILFFLAIEATEEEQYQQSLPDIIMALVDCKNANKMNICKMHIFHIFRLLDAPLTLN